MIRIAVDVPATTREQEKHFVNCYRLLSSRYRDRYETFLEGTELIVAAQNHEDLRRYVAVMKTLVNGRATPKLTLRDGRCYRFQATVDAVQLLIDYECSLTLLQ